MAAKFHKIVLKNGMTVLFEKRDVPVVSISFAIKTGGINEGIDEKGISHFIEHMVYKGTPTRNAKKIAEEIEKHGGESNAFTDELMTVFYCKIPSKHLNVALDVLSDMVKNSLFDEKELEKEKKVIFEEIKLKKDNPLTYSFKEVHKLLYEEPFGAPLIGTEKNLKLIDRNKLLARFRQAYQPNNIILCVVGEADLDSIINFAEKTFNRKKIENPKVKIKLKNGEKTEKRKGIDQANLIFAYHIPLANDRKSYAARILSTLMAGGMSSRLFQEIREKRNLAYAVKEFSEITIDFAHTFIYVGTSKENVERIKKLILDEFAKVAEELTEEELNQIKEQMIGNYQISMEDSQMQMVNLVYYEVNGKAEDFYNYEKNINDVKLDDVKKLAKIKNYSFFALVPEE